MGSAEQFQVLRSALRELRYDEASICARTGCPSVFAFQRKHEGRRTGTELNDALDALIHVLMDGEVLPEARLRSLVPAPVLAALESLGVIARTPDSSDSFYATVLLYPVASLYVVSDRVVLLDKSDGTTLPDVVYAANATNTERFLSALPQAPCETLLDLCSGSGIAALIGAARYAKQVWSCDLAKRSVYFADFNARLNGLENITCAQGDLYQAVCDLTFDRIVAHPPFVPAADQKIIFRDGGADGEQVLRGVIAGLPRHLRQGGRCYCVTMGTDRENSKLEQRIRSWLGESQDQFDLMLVAHGLLPKEVFLKHVAEQTVPTSIPAGPDRELLDALKVTAVFYGAVVIERITGSRPPATDRVCKGRTDNGEAIDWFVRWTTAAAAPDFDHFLLGSRPHAAPQSRLTIEHTVRNRALVPSHFQLRSDYPFLLDTACPPWLAMLVNLSNGRKPLAEIIGDLRRMNVVHPEVTPSQLLPDIRMLLARGVLELEEFPLPVVRQTD
jgi:SAM-dependent methyltransferase